MTMRRFLLVPMAVAALALTACASPSSESPAAPGAPSSVTVTPSLDGVVPSVVPSLDPGIPLPEMSGKPDKPLEITVTGQVTAGVEPGCRILSDGRTSYLLLGGDESVAKVGARVTVTGTLGENIMSTCQQGTPLQVKSVQAG
ncbi:hypothetical protein J2S43_000043 [Catenuloplanes nepalensis]|uniref:Lipoprotein n=1 Tax=Catenuloplanes nepalensis TaxID=587533 RepID=A0ABT9MJC9_9ACTN|nr:hypothetical protein [Catenuloplanes nepalensis]MDP9791531.1 hypothetical protein [Catenuloplanes nepalensis]